LANNRHFFPIKDNDYFFNLLHKCQSTAEGEIPHFRQILHNRIFSDGEYSPRVKDFLNVGNKDGRLKGQKAYIGVSYTSQILAGEQFGRVLILANSLKKAQAEEIDLIMAYTPFARQDLDPEKAREILKSGKKIEPKEEKKNIDTVGSSYTLEVLITHSLFAGIDKIVTFDVHNPNSVYEIIREYDEAKGIERDPKTVFFNIDPAPLYANHLIKHIAPQIGIGINGENLVVAYPDEGSIRRVKKFLDVLDLSGISEIFCDKVRLRPNDPSALETVVKKTSENYSGLSGKTLVFFEDIGDTFGTGEKTLKGIELWEAKRLGENVSNNCKPNYVIYYVSHPILSQLVAHSRIYDNRINIITTNTRANIMHHTEESMDQTHTLDISPIFFETIIKCVEPSIPFEGGFRYDLKSAKRFYRVIKEDPPKKLVKYC